LNIEFKVIFFLDVSLLWDISLREREREREEKEKRKRKRKRKRKKNGKARKRSTFIVVSNSDKWL
jgi:predicted RNA-binding protein with RPS1 domain